MTRTRAEDEGPAALECEMAEHLARAGITLPPGRMAGVLREYAVLKEQIATVSAACSSELEPTTIVGVAPDPAS